MLGTYCLLKNSYFHKSNNEEEPTIKSQIQLTWKGRSYCQLPWNQKLIKKSKSKR